MSGGLPAALSLYTNRRRPAVLDLFRKNRNRPLHARIDPLGAEITVAAGRTLLQAALAAGIPFPHNCRVGSCTTCKCRLVSGKIRALTDSAYVLSAADLKAGYILACQSALKTDVHVVLDRLGLVLPKPRVVAAVIRGTRFLTHDILELSVELDEPLTYIAGQYAQLGVAGIEPARSYSFARAPSDQQVLLFHVRLVPGGEMSEWLRRTDRTGTRLELDAPHGSFYLYAAAAPILCVAGGSGMAPIKAILEQALRDNCRRDVLYLYGARRQPDLYCLDEIAEIGRQWKGRFEFLPVLSEEPPDSDWRGARGLVTDWIGRSGFDVRAAHAYLCGPPAMVDAAAGVLSAAGVAAYDIHFDKFLDRRHTAIGTSRPDHAEDVLHDPL